MNSFCMSHQVTRSQIIHDDARVVQESEESDYDTDDDVKIVLTGPKYRTFTPGANKYIRPELLEGGSQVWLVAAHEAYQVTGWCIQKVFIMFPSNLYRTNISVPHPHARRQ
jgi:phosphatidylserine/phosphatidylglycerophosphate/cardiolipin synthase-like enzyme